jgi:hypothetical protein
VVEKLDELLMPMATMRLADGLRGRFRSWRTFSTLRPATVPEIARIIRHLRW